MSLVKRNILNVQRIQILSLVAAPTDFVIFIKFFMIYFHICYFLLLLCFISFFRFDAAYFQYFWVPQISMIVIFRLFLNLFANFFLVNNTLQLNHPTDSTLNLAELQIEYFVSFLLCFT